MLITPEYVFKDVTHITPEWLAAKGITALVLDIDNTLTADRSQELPEEVAAPLRVLDPEASDASWALRWVASRPGAAVLLSGMTTMEQLEDNLATLGQFRPLCPEEEAGVDETTLLLKQRVKNGCTGCRYCMPCPAGVDIPESFRIWNSMGMYENQRLTRRSWKGLGEGARPANCVGCGRCEELCPQHISIRRDLVQVTAQVEEFIEK